jgi:putative transposase
VNLRKAYRYCLYLTKGQAERLQWVLDGLDRCRELYNAALEERRDAYRMAGVTVNYYAQKRELPGVKEERPEYRVIGSQVLQDVIGTGPLPSRGCASRTWCATLTWPRVFPTPAGTSS